MQKAFASALKHLGPPSGLKSYNGSDVNQRFSVYRNNVAVALQSNLETRFPTVRQLIGAETFAAIAHQFIAQHPPRSALMHLHGAEFSAFVGAQAALVDLRYLPDVAALDFVQGEIFYEADCPDLNPDTLASLAPEDLPSLQFTLKKSLRVIASQFPIYSIWAAHQGKAEFEKIDLSQAETVLVLRQHNQVMLLPCAAEAGVAIAELATGKTLAELAAENIAPEILQQVLGQLLSLGLISSFKKES